MSKRDPIFNLSVPVIFAHRGGAAESPESTIAGFLHGLRSGADVLEADVQLTKDAQPVIWHGPDLDAAFDANGAFRTGVRIWDCTWREVSTELWVRHPQPPGDEPSKLEHPHRRLMTLRQFLDFVSAVKKGDFGDDVGAKSFHLNIELKKTGKPAAKWTKRKVAGMPGRYPYLQRVLDILNEHSPPDTTVVVASASNRILSRFRCIQDNAYKTNLSIREQIAYSEYFAPAHVRAIGALLDLFVAKEMEDLSGHAFQTAGALVTERLVREVHDHNGGIYAFLTAFPFLPELEPSDGAGVGSEEYTSAVQDLINKGVDGVMTDYPSIVSRILRK